MGEGVSCIVITVFSFFCLNRIDLGSCKWFCFRGVIHYSSSQQYSTVSTTSHSLKQHPTSSNSTLQNSLQQPPAVIYSLQQSSIYFKSLQQSRTVFKDLQLFEQARTVHLQPTTTYNSLQQLLTAYNRLQPLVVVQPSYLQ